MEIFLNYSINCTEKLYADNLLGEITPLASNKFNLSINTKTKIL